MLRILSKTELHPHQARVTHETLENRRWAGAALELETSRGRTFSFEPVCSRTPKHKRTTITADPGMEILSLKIKSGKLIGFEQQPCGEESTTDKDWFNVIYQGTKEEDVEIKEFSDRQEAVNWWKKITARCSMKTGRGALYLDTKQNVILNKTGSANITTRLISVAEERGVYLNMKEHTTKLSIPAVLSAVSKALLTKQDTIRMVIVTVMVICSKVLELEILNLTGNIISTLSDNTTVINQNIYANTLCQTFLECNQDSRFDYIKSMLVSFVLMVLLERLVYLGNVYIHIRGLYGIMGALRTKSLEKALFLHQGYHDSHTQADLNNNSNIHSVSRLISWNFPYALAHLLGIFASGVYMVKKNLQIGGAVVLFTVLFNILYLMPGKREAMRLQRCRTKLASSAEDLINEALDMVSTVKQFSQEKLHIEEQRVAESSWISCELKLVLNRIQNEFVEHAFKYLLLAVMIAYEATAVESVFRPGEFMIFYILFDRFQHQFTCLNSQIELFEEDLSKVENYVEFMSTPSEVVSGKEPVGSLEEDIQFENVNFGYPTRIGEKVFSGLNLKIQRKKMTAIVGDSGSGKTTIAKLLMRLYDPQQGKVTIGGKDIRNFNLAELHGKMAIVSQNPNLMSTTLMDNISYGAAFPDQVTISRIKNAAELANCDFINKFRSGMETFAGARGLQLSGGQKQRIAIARAAMRDPEILILDEATSALDAQNERDVQEALDKLMAGKTTIVIAHRLSTVRHADEIICLKDGEVQERGTHDELMGLRNYYANLVSKQLVEDTCKIMKQNTRSEVDMIRLMRRASETFIRQSSQLKNGRLIDEVRVDRGQSLQNNEIADPLIGNFELDENNFGPSG